MKKFLNERWECTAPSLIDAASANDFCGASRRRLRHRSDAGCCHGAAFAADNRENVNSGASSWRNLPQLISRTSAVSRCFVMSFCALCLSGRHFRSLCLRRAVFRILLPHWPPHDEQMDSRTGVKNIPLLSKHLGIPDCVVDVSFRRALDITNDAF